MKVSITITLHENSSTSEEGCISHDDKGALDIGEVENWGSLKVGQQHRKGILLVRSPSPGLVFTSQCGEGGYNVRETGDELAIKITKYKEGADSCDSFGQRPSHNG